MANSTTGFGLSVSGRQDGVAPTYATRLYPILYTYSTAIGQGDAVKLNSSTGNVERYAAGDTLALGVASEFSWMDNSSLKSQVWSNYWPGSPTAVSGSAKAYVIDDANASFLVRVSGANVDQTAIGSNVELVTTNTPDTVSGMSTETVLSGSQATTATLPLRVISILPTGPSTFGYNDSTLANNIIEVKLNSVNMNSTTGV